MKTAMIRAAGAAVVVVSSSVALGGPLTPPVGPVSPTNKTLLQVEPRVPIETVAGTATSMHRITQPGSYYLTGNIALAAGKDTCIEIAADGVSIDLGGFTLDGLNSTATRAVRVTEKFSCDGLRVANGHITDWGTGIDGLSMFGAVFEGLRLTFNDDYGIDAGYQAVVKGCTAVVCGNAFYLRDGGVISDCTASFSGRGFDFGGSANASACVARDCGQGFYVNVNSTVNACTAGNCSTGFFGAFGNSLTGCNAQSCNDGFSFAERSVLTGCRAGGAAGPGIVVGNDSVVERCTVAGAGLIGITIGENSSVRGCDVKACGGVGIYAGFGSGAMVVDNHVTGCSLDHGIFCEGSFGRVDGNTVSGSGKFGIAVGGLGNLVVSNYVCKSSQLSGGFADYSVVTGNNSGPVVTGNGVFTATSPYANFSCGFVLAETARPGAAPAPAKDAAITVPKVGPAAYPGEHGGPGR